jgi:NhaA family Na+:H+ antiporter
MQLFGTAMLGGIGFTMSLFIGMLAFPDTHASGHVKLGVLSGSLISAVLGYLVLSRTNTRLRRGVTLRGGS